MTGDPQHHAAHRGQADTPNRGSDSDWIELSIEADGEAAEAVSAVFNQYCPGTVVFEQLAADKGANPLMRVKAYLPSDQASLLDTVQQTLWHMSQAYPLAELSTRHLSQADWMDAWKADYGVQHIGHRVVIKPSWQQHVAPVGTIMIEIDPGMAFGTGLHPSTRLSLEAIEDQLQVGDVVLDVGTGSGILAIAAAKMGASRVMAIDVDPIAVKVARQNVRRNRVADLVSLQCASLYPAPDRTEISGSAEVFNLEGDWSGAFDLLVMNILAPVIIRSATAIAALLAPEGTFVVSGLTDGQTPSVRLALRGAGLTVVRQRRQQDWVALVGHLSAKRHRAANNAPLVEARTGN